MYINFPPQRTITLDNYDNVIKDLTEAVSNADNPEDQNAENLAVISRVLVDTASILNSSDVVVTVSVSECTTINVLVFVHVLCILYMHACAMDH